MSSSAQSHSPECIFSSFPHFLVAVSIVSALAINNQSYHYVTATKLKIRFGEGWMIPGDCQNFNLFSIGISRPLTWLIQLFY